MPVSVLSVSVLLFVFQPSELNKSNGSKVDDSSDNELEVIANQ